MEIENTSRWISIKYTGNDDQLIIDQNQLIPGFNVMNNGINMPPIPPMQNYAKSHDYHNEPAPIMQQGNYGEGVPYPLPVMPIGHGGYTEPNIGMQGVQNNYTNFQPANVVMYDEQPVIYGNKIIASDIEEIDVNR